MHTGIEFNGKHSLRDFGLTVSNREIGYPSKIKRQERVPFSNEVYDFSNLYGGQEYEERSITYTLNLINKSSSGYRENFQNNQLLETKVVNWLMGANQKAILKDDTIDGYYFMAELVDGPNSEFRFVGSELTIEFIAYPFKISELQEGHDIWDEFNFELDVAQITKFEVSGTKEITLYNVGAEALAPTIVASTEFTIEKGAVSVTVPPGTNKSYLINLNVGENKLKLIGNGTIEFKFHKELI